MAFDKVAGLPSFPRGLFGDDRPDPFIDPGLGIQFDFINLPVEAQRDVIKHVCYLTESSAFSDGSSTRLLGGHWYHSSECRAIYIHWPAPSSMPISDSSSPMVKPLSLTVNDTIE